MLYVIYRKERPDVPPDLGLGDVVWCHRVTELEAGLLARCLRSSVFCGREELFIFQDIGKRYSTEQTCGTSTHFAPDWTSFCLFNLLCLCVCVCVIFFSLHNRRKTDFLSQKLLNCKRDVFLKSVPCCYFVIGVTSRETLSGFVLHERHRAFERSWPHLKSDWWHEYKSSRPLLKLRVFVKKQKNKKNPAY